MSVVSLHCGDCIEEMTWLPSASVDLILCDPPYGTTANKWDAVVPFEKMWPEYWRVAKPNAAIVLMSQCPFDKLLGASCPEWLRYEWIWQKEAGTGFLNAKRQPLKNHENALVFYRSPPTYNPQMRTGFAPYKQRQGRKSTNYGLVQPEQFTESTGERYPQSIIEFKRDRGLHPTQKPVALMRYFIETYSNPGDTVMDNCMGSGTTGVAAVQTGRNFIGIELDAAIYGAASRRIETEELM